MDNRSGEIAVFIVVAEHLSFSVAGRALGLSPSAVSKLVSRIENRLSTPLLVRSTRGLQLTIEGILYLEKVRRVLDDLDDAERMIKMGADAAPKGKLRVSASVGFGEACLLPIVPRFLQLYPEVELDISLTDTVVNLIDERTDIAIRSGTLPDSSLRARKLMESPRTIVASPAYLKKYGTPMNPDELREHNCLRFNFSKLINEWNFNDPITNASINIPINGNAFGNNGSILRQLALSNVGIAKIGYFHVAKDIEAGDLIPILQEYQSAQLESIHAMYVNHEHLAIKIRAFIDFMVKTL